MTIPENVRDYIRQIFRDCNLKISNKLSKYPATWETSLDFTFIEHLSNYAAPIQIEKDWTIRFDTHYLGGMRHWSNWEIADIGVLILFREKGKTIRSKIALLQSKRLYANELTEEDEDGRDTYVMGFGRLHEDNAFYNKIITPRTLNFTEASKYQAIGVKDDQWEAIKDYQTKTTIPIHYLFYNPCRIPHAIQMPLIADIQYTSFSVGARVLPAHVLFDKFDLQEKNYSPNYGELKYNLDAPFNEASNESGWRLEDFIADELILCREGYIVTNNNDPNLYAVFNRRSGPIACAFSITFNYNGQ